MKSNDYTVVKHFAMHGTQYVPGDTITLTDGEAKQMMNRRKPLVKNPTRYRTKDVRPAEFVYTAEHTGGPYFAIKRNGEEINKVKGREAADKMIEELITSE